MFTIHKCKREEYIKAWNYMYSHHKSEINSSELYNDVNPSLNAKPLGTEVDNFCVVAYDTENQAEGFDYGEPVGVFSFVVTRRSDISKPRIIGKQFLVLPSYCGKGIGRALYAVNEKQIFDNGYNSYYIGCSKCSSSMLKKYFKQEPYSEDVEGDMFKYDISLMRSDFLEQYREFTKDFNIV